MAKKYKEIETKVWKAENEGDQIEGVLIGKEAKTEDVGAKYTIENKEGAFLVWGSAILDDKMQQVKVGDELRITFDGQKDLGKKKKLNLYKVEVVETDEEETPAVEEEAVK
jgi:hypothetical protein